MVDGRRRHARRRQDRLPDFAVVGEQREQLLLFRRARQLDDGRNVGQVGMPLGQELNEEIDLLLLDPVPLVGLDREPAHGHALDLAALHRERGLRRALIAADDPELRSQNLVHHVGIDVDRRADAGRADGRIHLQRVGDRLDARRVPEDRDVVVGADAADPVELRGLELDRLRPEQLLGGRGLADVAERRPVLRRRLEQIVRRLEAAGARACSAARRSAGRECACRDGARSGGRRRRCRSRARIRSSG